MPNWKQLEKDISEWLSTFRSANVQFYNAHQAIAGLRKFRFRSDGMLASDRVLVAVEVEAGQVHPDTNVGKYWLLYAEHRQYQRIILFHVYTPDCRSKGRKKLGEFYAKQMKGKVPLDYIQRDFHDTTKDYQAVLAEIKAEIETVVKREFGAVNAS